MFSTDNAIPSREDGMPDKQLQHGSPEPSSQPLSTDHTYDEHHDSDDTDEENEDEDNHHLLGASSLKFLLAGGVAGVVSRTATAPFDRLKVYLMTASPNIIGSIGTSNVAAATASTIQRGTQVIWRAILNIYAEGGLRAFWVGNGLNTIKILPVRALIPFYV